MQINLTNELKKDSAMSHVILHGIAHAVDKNLVNKVAEDGKTDDGVVIDVVLTVNGNEVNLESFVNHWQSFVDEAITKSAKEMVVDKFGDTMDLMYDIENQLKAKLGMLEDD